MTNWTPASEHREYYHNNPYERGDWDMNEYEEALDEEIMDYLDKVDAADVIDFAYSQDFDAATAAIKKMAQAYFDGNDADLLVWAKALSKLTMDSMSDYVEKEYM